MPKLIMMVGVAGSGKSTIAKAIAQSSGAIIHSSDIIRGEIYGDENCQANPGRVFDILNQRTIKDLKAGFDVIYDATNLNCKKRMNFLKLISSIDCEKQCIVVVATPEDIAERMQHRDRKVPLEVVHRQLCQFQCPNYYEGWDEIEVKYTSTADECLRSYCKIWEECDIPHDNPHHSLSVLEHMERAADIAEDESWKSDDLSLVHERWVARIHDIGKPRCKSFVDRNGNITDVAHYFGHQNYGAYYSLVFDNGDFDISLEDSLDNACLIQWHMERYIRDSASLKKLYDMLGPKLSRRLHILEYADRAAH